MRVRDNFHTMINTLPSQFQVQLRANDFDRWKHLNNSAYLQLLEQGRWDWANVNKFLGVKDDYLVAVLAIEIAYIQPIEWDPDGVAQVCTKLLSIETFSFYLEQNIYHNSELSACAKVRLSILCGTTKKPLKLKGILA